MFFEITQWHKENPNFWCAVDKDTYKLIDTDCDLIKLAERMDAEGKNLQIIYCKNWSRPAEKK